MIINRGYYSEYGNSMIGLSMNQIKLLSVHKIQILMLSYDNDVYIELNLIDQLPNRSLFLTNNNATMAYIPNYFQVVVLLYLTILLLILVI